MAWLGREGYGFGSLGQLFGVSRTTEQPKPLSFD